MSFFIKLHTIHLANNLIRHIMKKLLLSILLIAGTCLYSIAQTYTFSYSTSTFTLLSGATSVNSSVTWNSFTLFQEIPIGFTFNSFNQSFDTLYVGAGYVAFSSNQGANYLIAYEGNLMDRDTIGSVSPVSYELSGTAGSRILKIEWYNAGIEGEKDSLGTLNEYLDVQMWLYEGTDVVEVHIGDNIITAVSFYGEPGPYIGMYDGFFDETNIINGSSSSPYLTMSDFMPLLDIPASGMVYTFTPGGHCSNGVMDGDETGVDCGGIGCVACHCDNDVQDVDETGVDCGGADCGDCPIPDGCAYDNTLYLILAAPTAVGDSVYDPCISGGEYDQITGLVAGNTYRISTCNTSIVGYDSQISIYPAGGGTSVADNDDFCDLLSQVFFTPATSGDYDVLIDAYPCDSDVACVALTVELVAISGGSCDPVPMEICLVTNDSSDNKNVVVWEKLSYPVVGGSYNIYRETNEANKFDLIGNVPYANLSIFKDLTAQPETRPYRYKITSVNNCDIESDQSPIHKTLKLTVNQGLGGVYNLIWTNYEGIDFLTYKVWRYTTNGDSIIATIPSNITIFTDPNPLGSTIMYQLEMVHPSGGCTADKGKSYNSSKSNTASVGGTPELGVTATGTAATGPCDGTALATAGGGAPPYTYAWNTNPVQTTATATGLCGSTSYTITVTDGSLNSSTSTVFISGPVSIEQVIPDDFFDVYPNPNQGSFMVDLNLSGSDTWTLKIFNLLGSEVHAEALGVVNGNMIKSIDLQENVKGIYYVQLSSDRDTLRKKVIVY